MIDSFAISLELYNSSAVIPNLGLKVGLGRRVSGYMKASPGGPFSAPPNFECEESPRAATVDQNNNWSYVGLPEMLYAL